MFINTFRGYDGDTGNGIIHAILSHTNNTHHPRNFQPVAVYEIDINENLNYIKNSDHVFFKSNSLEVSLATLLEEDISYGNGLIEEFIPGFKPRTDCGTPNIYVNIKSIKTALNID